MSAMMGFRWRKRIIYFLLMPSLLGFVTANNETASPTIPSIEPTKTSEVTTGAELNSSTTTEKSSGGSVEDIKSSPSSTITENLNSSQSEFKSAIRSTSSTEISSSQTHQSSRTPKSAEESSSSPWSSTHGMDSTPAIHSTNTSVPFDSLDTSSVSPTETQHSIFSTPVPSLPDIPQFKTSSSYNESVDITKPIENVTGTSVWVRSSDTSLANFATTTSPLSLEDSKTMEPETKTVSEIVTNQMTSSFKTVELETKTVSESVTDKMTSSFKTVEHETKAVSESVTDHMTSSFDTSSQVPLVSPTTVIDSSSMATASADSFFNETIPTLPSTNVTSEQPLTPQTFHFIFVFNATKCPVEDELTGKILDVLRGGSDLRNETPTNDGIDVGDINVWKCRFETTKVHVNVTDSGGKGRNELMKSILTQANSTVLVKGDTTYKFVDLLDGNDKSNASVPSDSSSDAHVQSHIVSKEELHIFIAIGTCFGLLILIALIICCVKCFCQKKEPKSVDITDIPHLNMRLEDYSLTKIPRPNTVYSDYLHEPVLRSHNHYAVSRPTSAGYQAGPLSQPFDTSVVPLEDTAPQGEFSAVKYTASGNGELSGGSGSTHMSTFGRRNKAIKSGIVDDSYCVVNNSRERLSPYFAAGGSASDTNTPKALRQEGTENHCYLSST